MVVSREKGEAGFSLVEVLIALAIMGIALLGLVTVLASGMKAQDKLSKSVLARSVASTVFERTVNEMGVSSPDDVEDFWDQDVSSEQTPYRSGTEMVGNTAFDYVITATEVRGTDGAPFGTATGQDGNRLKFMTVTVRWAADGAEAKVGTGKQEIKISRLLNRAQR